MLKEQKTQNLKYKKTNTNKGITLISLIITIILMLILASVTISMAVGGGLFENAEKSASDTEKAMNAVEQLANGKIKVAGKWIFSLNDKKLKLIRNMGSEVRPPSTPSSFV